MDTLLTVCVGTANMAMYTVAFASQVIMYSYIIAVYSIPCLIVIGGYKLYKVCTKKEKTA